MKRLLVVAAIVVIAVPALAGSDILRIDGAGYLKYDMKTGKVTPVEAQSRAVGPPLWITARTYVNYFWASDPALGEAGLDWGDIDDSRPFGGFGFSQFTNSQASSGDLWGVILMYEEENGHDSAGRVYTVGYLIDNIPGSTHTPTEYWGYYWAVEVFDPFVLDGSDLDGDGLGDFGYWQFFSVQDAGALNGPGLCGLLGQDPNNLPPECPGIEDAFDLFANPAWLADWNDIDPNNLSADFAGTYYFGGGPNEFSQFYFALYAPVCPNRGDSGKYCEADIDGTFDCMVGLGDLAQLLGHYGCTSGCGLLDGDVDPYDVWWPGDGDVDLADLAELLSQYGDDCTLP